MAQPKYKISQETYKWLAVQLLLLFLTINAKSSFGVNGDVNSDCLRCGDLNRLNKLHINCAQIYEDCGECFPGFITDPDDNRFCFGLEIVESSENMLKNLSENVYLACKFNAQINCQWKKNDMEIQITETGPYKWTRSNGILTDDCSINIISLKNEDTGKWVCSNKADSNFDSVKSEPIILSTLSKLLAQPENNYTVETGEKLELKCQFNQNGNCYWDCSLTIHSFDPCKDVGTWQCQRPGDSETEATVSNITHLYSKEETDCNTVQKQSSANTKISNTKEPKIVLNDYDITRINVDYNPGTDDQMLLDLSCTTSNVPSRMSWLIHGEAEYPGIFVADNTLKATEDLKNSIINHLKTKNQLKLLCLVEYPDKQTHSASVTLVLDGQLLPEVIVASFNNVLTFIYVLLSIIFMILLVTIGASIYCLCKHYKQSKNDWKDQNKKANKTSAKSESHEILIH
ncbi:hypothetical protein CHUAL_001762 [Chamberlinius hualienensis]